MKSSIDLVMFDLDGTLADTGRDLTDSVNFTRSHFNLTPLPVQLVYSYVGRGAEYLLKQALPEAVDGCFHEVMRVFLRHYESHLLDTTTLYPHVRETLDYFSHKKKVVVTNKLRHLSVAILRGLGVESCFEGILGGDSAPKKKPHPALLNDTLERFNVAGSKAIMVGDSDTDIEAGKRAGVMTCGVTYGLGRRADLIDAKPDVLIDDIAELADKFY